MNSKNDIEVRKSAISFYENIDQESIGRIEKIGADEYVFENQENYLKNILLFKIINRMPFSFVRLGDGEGNCLFWNYFSNLYPELAEWSMRKIWSLMFGNVASYNEDYDKISCLVSDAMKNADILGVHTDHQFDQALSKVASCQDDFDIRGMVGVLAVREVVFRKGCFVSEKNKIITSCHSHKMVANFFEELIKAANNVSVVTCHSHLLKLLHSKASVSEGRSILIPPQALNIKSTPKERHFPDVFEDNMRELETSDLTGQLFFVGAGLLGKAYCNQIKKSGGFAIDVGSMMDVWVGKGVRGYQNEDYVSRYSLI